MNIDTGELFNADPRKTLKELLKLNNNLIQVDQKDMTKKQEKNMHVSLNDNKSKLGKQRLTAIQERKQVFGK